MKREDIKTAGKLEEALKDAENRRKQVDVTYKYVAIEYGSGSGSYGPLSLPSDSPEALAIMAIVKSNLDRRIAAIEKQIETL